MPTGFVYPANTSLVVIKGVEFKLLQNIEVSDDYGHNPESGIGDIHVLEYVAGQARHRGRISATTERANQPIVAGIIPQNGDAVLTGEVFEIEIFDKVSGNLLRRLERAEMTSGRMTVTAHRVVMHDADFVAIDVGGEF